MRLTKQQRETIYRKSNGVCWYCGKILPKKGWHSDHFLPVGRIMKYDKKKRKKVWTGKYRHPERDHIDNMVPSCAECNRWKKSRSISTFRKSLQVLHKTVLNHTNVRMAVKYQHVKILNPKIVFWFEKRGNDE